MMMLRMMMRSKGKMMKLRIMMSRRRTNPKTRAHTLCASLRCQNALAHVRRAILFQKSSLNAENATYQDHDADLLLVDQKRTHGICGYVYRYIFFQPREDAKKAWD